MFSKKKLFIYLGIPILIFIVASIGYAANIYNQTEEIITESHQEDERENERSKLREEKIEPIEDNVSVLFIGVDNSKERGFQNETSRSDALILATFNKDNNSIKLLSIPRDTYVYVPEIEDYTKINHAHFFGGPLATIETVEQFLEVPVDYFVRMDLNAFVDVVDELGGIMYDVPYEITEMDSEDREGAIHLQPGLQNLNGEEALALVRTRKYDNDVERGKRQQEMMKAIVDKAISLSSVFKIEDILRAVSSNMDTSLTFPEITNFATYALRSNLQIDSINLEGNGGYRDDGLWYYQVDDESRAQIQEELKDHLDIEERMDLSNYAGEDDYPHTDY